ncbi:HlyD family type I secretion periplasmic adaptor subunit [Salipiger sp. PrR002]|uniref:HlyD family type I secretion periplasmic adaptor subunit n=1 Tax=Salipiger sp. PrR002 TaxID=2706489 RepID=UPI0013B7849D|nr:HlyD family type I secretion periplasmic adaptor subunit [Salipiger sp. PrR002]NDW01139.1 HlyD family type I secretion periplasmic adaptor subunit [Salipiger sp. PrR002]NDW57942.1 HlyD family type I secretion periplasmic adaptor subunit [Salipiger sp. PrR004]
MSDLIETDAPWYAEVPCSVSKFAVLGLGLMVAAFGGFALWAFAAPLAAAVIAQGSFVATGRNKIVQHLEGGIIEQIYVSEGQLIHAGEQILSLDRTAAQASERELHLRRYRLRAIAERLYAEYREETEMVFSEALTSEADDPEFAAILDSQRLAHAVSRKSLANDITLLRKQIDALRVRESGYVSQLEFLRLRADILKEEFADKNKLFERNLVQKSELNAIRRIQAEAEGQLARLDAEVDEIRQMVLRYTSEISAARAVYRQTALDELGPIEADLESITEQARKARNVLDRSVVRAPVTGTVVRLHFHTPGGVIETGKPIVELLPADAPLIIEVQIPRTDIDSVMVGQEATVRLIALNQRTTPVLQGEVTYISADSLHDPEMSLGQEMYIARISLPPEQVGRVPGFAPTPGMPVEIMIMTQTRTFAAYISKPILDSMSRAFREQ